MSSNVYSFSWDLIGDIGARENLGEYTRVEIYRLMQFSLRDILEKRLGREETDAVFRAAGQLAGEQFYEHFITPGLDFNAFSALLQSTLKELGIGIMRIEEADLAKGSVTLSVAEDLDCSGLPELDYEFCAYDEGFLAGILGKYTGRVVDVHEVDCWCTGDRTCRFTAKF